MDDITMEVTNSQPNCSPDLDETKKSHKTLLDLNDDCLLKVFKYLNIIDLINVSETCTKLQDVVKLALTKYTIFRLWNYKCYRNQVKQPITLEKFFAYTAPFIVSLELSHAIDGNNLLGSIVQDDLNLCRSLEGKSFPKLKSLDIDNSSLLKSINFNNLEELKIREVNQNDFNNFTDGITTLKKLIIGRFHEDISSDELRGFLEKNPNIECLEFYLLFPLRFPYNVLPQLRNLTKLSLKVEKREPNWYSFLQINNLIELKVEYIDHTDSLPLIIYLENLAQKKTLKKIELINMAFRDQELNILELLDVPKLRIVPRHTPRFISNLEALTLANLTHLDVMVWINESEMFCLIEKFKKLEQLKIYYKNDLLMDLQQLFDSSTISRPALTLINYHEKDHIKIFFDLCTYERITYPSADLKRWDGESASIERSNIFSDWFDHRVKTHTAKMIKYARNFVCPYKVKALVKTVNARKE